MSRVVLGLGASHTTLMNTRWDEVAHLDRACQFRDALRDARERLEHRAPDLAVIVGSNHFSGTGLDLMPAFTIGVGDLIGAGEHGTPAGPQITDPPAALRLCERLVDSGIDMAFSTELMVDHGISHAIQYLLPEGVPVVAVVINVFAPPLPTLLRTCRFGYALGSAAHALPGDRRVVVIGTGGLSHTLPFPDWSSPSTDDDRFLVESWRQARTGWSTNESRRRRISALADPTRPHRHNRHRHTAPQGTAPPHRHRPPPRPHTGPHDRPRPQHPHHQPNHRRAPTPAHPGPVKSRYPCYSLAPVAVLHIGAGFRRR